MSNSTITLQTIVNLARTHIELLPIANVGGFTDEPALSLCNDVLQELIAKPQAWKFNRTEMAPFVTAVFRQDYQFGGAVAFTSNAGGAGIKLTTASSSTSGVSRTLTTVTVRTLEEHNFAIGDTVYMLGNDNSVFNSTYSQTPTGSGYTGGWTITTTPSVTSFQFEHATSATTLSGAAGITNFGWLESATMRELRSAAPIPGIYAIEAVNTLPLQSYAANPQKVAVLADNGDGTLKIRFDSAAGTVPFVANLIYQARPALKTALSDTWAPFPDEYSFVFRQAFLARAYRYVNSPRADIETQKADMAVGKALMRDDAEASDQRLYPDQGLMRGGWGGWYDNF
jgi:hypothetical protein